MTTVGRWNIYAGSFDPGGGGDLTDWLMDQFYVPLADEENQFLSMVVTSA